MLKGFPDGKIFCIKNGKCYKWYLTDGKTQTYLPKHKRQLAEKLAAKKYLPLLMEDYLHEKKAIDFYLRHHNPKYPEQLIHKTFSGRYVRSKSEVMIDMLLNTHKIPFRYEAPLTLGDTIIYPDFTIRHPETGKLFYWEHFGLVDDPSYCQNMLSKLKLL